jgi:DNA-binding transcriptional MerR regulator
MAGVRTDTKTAPRRRTAAASNGESPLLDETAAGDPAPDSAAPTTAGDSRPEAVATLPHDLTIEQLAAEVGMSVRNIRNHHSRGLLEPPEVRARVGFYSAEHVARLRLIQDLQADGFNLAAIERLLSGSDGLAGRLLGLRAAVTAPFEPETPEIVTAEELAQRFGEAEPKDLERVRRLRVLAPLGQDRYEVRSPALLDAAEQVMALGIPLRTTLELIERVGRDCDSVSRGFVKLFMKELWEPFEKIGQPEEGWEELIEAVDSLRPLASEALLAMFKLRMTSQLEEAFGRVIEHQAKRR